ncbi:hypothetical protein F4801DRAFT_600025 [Xylaria longipes]|nr:hypothetical protein F4801DRAFT_600025 [Xylaria longipes]
MGSQQSDDEAIPNNTTQATSSGSTADNEIGHGDSSHRENINDSQQASVIGTGIVNESTGAGPSCLSNPTSANNSMQDLADALLELNFKEMLYGTDGKNELAIRPPSSVGVPHPLRLVNELGEKFASHDPKKPLKPVRHKDEPDPFDTKIPISFKPKKKKSTKKPASDDLKKKPLEPDQRKMPRTNASDLLDRHEKIMAAILTRFRNMVYAAGAPLPGSVAVPQASLNLLTMQNEATALIKETENLLSLTREIKQLWIIGPLRKPGDANERKFETEMDERAAGVSKLHSTLVELQTELAKKSAAQQPPSAPEDQPVDVKEEKGGAPVKQEHQGDSA